MNYSQRLLIDCLNELYTLDFEELPDGIQRIVAIEKDIEQALIALHGQNSFEYQTNIGLLTGPTDKADPQQWRVERAIRKIRHIVDDFPEQTSSEPEPEVVIQIIVKIFIDLENLRRQQHAEPPMTEEEETSMRQRVWKFFESSLSTLKNGGDVVKLINQYSDFFRFFLPPP